MHTIGSWSLCVLKQETWWNIPPTNEPPEVVQSRHSSTQGVSPTILLDSNTAFSPRDTPQLPRLSPNTTASLSLPRVHAHGLWMSRDYPATSHWSVQKCGVYLWASRSRWRVHLAKSLLSQQWGTNALLNRYIRVFHFISFQNRWSSPLGLLFYLSPTHSTKAAMSVTCTCKVRPLGLYGLDVEVWFEWRDT